MVYSWKSQRIASVCAVALVTLSACSTGSDPIPVSYAASSTSGADIEVTYETADGSVTEVVSSPWALDVDRSGDFSADLEVVNLELDGMVSCAVEPGGLRPVNADGEASASCLVSVSSGGGSTQVAASASGAPFVRDAAGDAVALPTDLPEPVWAEADTVTAIDERRFLLSGHKGVHLLDTSDGSIELISGSDRFGNPLDVAMDDDGNLYAANIFDDHVQVLAPTDGAEPVEIAIWPDEGPSGLWYLEGLLFVKLADVDELVAIDTDGNEQWRAPLGYDEIVTKMTSLGDGQVAIALGDQVVLGFDASTGEATFEWNLHSPISAFVRDGDLLYLSFADGDLNSTVVISVDAAVREDLSETREFPGYHVVFDPSGTPYTDAGGAIHRIDPDTMTVDATIETTGRLLAVGDDALFVAERVGSASDTLEISQLPLSLFGE